MHRTLCIVLFALNPTVPSIVSFPCVSNQFPQSLIFFEWHFLNGFFRGSLLTQHPLFAKIYSLLGGCDRKALSQQRTILAKEAYGRVLELGCGPGFNFPYYRKDQGISEVTATDPDQSMVAYAAKAALGAEVRVVVETGAAEKVNYPDASFDCVVSTLVLCTVSSPAEALTEIRRVLKPGGKFLFLEHVASQKKIWSVLQRVLDPVWCRLAGGCRLCRKTQEAISAHGFRIEKCEAVGNVGIPLLPLIQGIARNL